VRFLRVIIMASGLSKRFGTNKLFAQVNGRPMYCSVLNNVSAFFKNHPEAGIGIVVSAYEEILHQADQLGLIPIFNANPEEGQANSIKIGLAFSLKDDFMKHEAAVFLTADQPWLKTETLSDFLLSASSTSNGFLCASAKDVLGSPVSFDQRYYPELFALKGDSGGKAVVKNHLDEVEYFDMDISELRDIDVPEDIV